jgi:hypothetical protein
MTGRGHRSRSIHSRRFVALLLDLQAVFDNHAVNDPTCSAAVAGTNLRGTTMAKTEPKKPSFPTKPCPKCGKPIHARLQRHEACGWVMTDKTTPAAPKLAAKKKLGRPKKIHATANAGSIALQDIVAVKALVEKVGAEKVRQLAEVLG